MNAPEVVAPKVVAPLAAPKLNPDVNELAVVVGVAVVVAAAMPSGVTEAVGNAGGADVKDMFGAAEVVLAAGAPNENPAY